MAKRPAPDSALRPPAGTAMAPSPAAVPGFIRWTPQGCVLDLAVVPNARRTQADGLHDGALRVRLAAPPVDGAANEALTRWLADALRVARRQVVLLRGQTSRRKTVSVQAERTCIVTWLASLDVPAD